MAIYSLRKELLPLAREIILRLNQESSFSEFRLSKIRNAMTKSSAGIELPKNLELIEAYQDLIRKGEMKPRPELLEVIQKRKVRTLSGIANITVLTKDLGCPGQCIFCPTEKGMPKSYLSNEPAMMRAVRNEFSAYKQVKTRLNGLVAQGHEVTKIDVRTAGGTWGAVPIWYQLRFLKGIFLALNEGPGEFTPDEVIEEKIKAVELESLLLENETAHCRCVGLWVETRPDWVDVEELKRLRSYGVTGIELGVQTTDDKVNEFNKRGHGLAESIAATKLCRDVGLKVCHHLMPNLPTATLESDVKSGRDLFELDGLRPDYLKIYPTMVTPFSDLEKMVAEDPSVHTPYTDEELIDLIADTKSRVPEYCRIIRVIRDIPAESIILGSKKSNLRQIMQRRGIQCRCVRCREIQEAEFTIENSKLKIENYPANGGTELFLQIEEPTLDKLIALCRLRFPDPAAPEIFPELKGAALVRELHVYGRTKTLPAFQCHSCEGRNLECEHIGIDSRFRGNDNINSFTQHLGFGKLLMKEAEDQSRKAGYQKLAVIAAIGTREYYRKLGYQLEGTYMVKSL